MQPDQSSPRVHDAPAADRPRERLRSLGAPALRTAELLAILIRSGRPGESALQAGEKIAARFKDQLDRLADAGRGELRGISPAIAETAYCQIMAGIEGLLVNSYLALVQDDEQGEERYAGYRLMARQLWQTYMSKIPKERTAAIGLPPLEDIDRVVRDRLLDPQHGLSPQMRLVLRSKLGLGKESAVPPPAPPERAEASKP